MNINLELQPLKKFKFGKILNKLFTFEVRWYDPTNINQPYTVKEKEVNRLKKAIKNGDRLEPIVMLFEFGPVAGIHLLEAFKLLKFDKVPVLYGKLTKN